jgi:hypothetical protein
MKALIRVAVYSFPSIGDVPPWKGQRGVRVR